MKELKYIRTNSTAKSGVEYMNRMVNYHNCILQEIDTKNDLGIDAIIEIIKDEKPTSKFIAVQIKSGKTYYNNEKEICHFPVGKHRDYWVKHPLPVYGIVYIPETDIAYWVDIKEYLDFYPKAKTIIFKKTLVNRIIKKTFFSIFASKILSDVPDLSYEFSNKLFLSGIEDEFDLGLFVLFKKYSHKNEVWEKFVEFLKSNQIDKIPSALIHYLSYCPWHPDLWHASNNGYTEKSRKFCKRILADLKKDEVIKLLYFVDEESMLSRGSLGQCVEAIISLNNRHNEILEDIMFDDDVEPFIREVAGVLYAYKNQLSSITTLENMKHPDFRYIPRLIIDMKQYDGFQPYM